MRRKKNRVVYNLEEASKHGAKVRGLEAAFQDRFLNFNIDRANPDFGSESYIVLQIFGLCKR